ARLCAKHRAFQEWKVRGNAERLKWQEMSRSRKNGLGFAKLFSGRRVRKTETNVFEIRRDFEFCPRGGRVWEGIRAGFGFLFWRALRKKIHNNEISAKPRYEICIVLDPPTRSRTNPRRF
ncbi:MAG: hypothetical protein Q7K16_03295, partial [Candidatus Azambacteria bacterium]|nr:hypothetical protein [Candidatus Azambacteria bacterium]